MADICTNEKLLAKSSISQFCSKSKHKHNQYFLSHLYQKYIQAKTYVPQSRRPCSSLDSRAGPRQMTWFFSIFLKRDWTVFYRRLFFFTSLSFSSFLIASSGGALTFTVLWYSTAGALNRPGLEIMTPFCILAVNTGDKRCPLGNVASFTLKPALKGWKFNK